MSLTTCLIIEHQKIATNFSCFLFFVWLAYTSVCCLGEGESFSIWFMVPYQISFHIIATLFTR